MDDKELLIEFKLCQANPKYFIEKYVPLETHKGTVKFKLYELQEELLNEFQNNRFNLVIKSRQVGLTTLLHAYVLWLMIFHHHKAIYFLGQNSISLEAIKKLYSELPAIAFFPKIMTSNKNCFTLYNNSTVGFIGWRQTSSGCGQAMDLLVFEEAAFCEQAEEHWWALYPTLSRSGSCICTGTPFKNKGWFYELYRKTVSKETDWKLHEISWDSVPNRGKRWFHDISRYLSPSEIKAEVLGKFV
jgi:hypothetical protein